MLGADAESTTDDRYSTLLTNVASDNYEMLFADSAERAIVQATMMGSVAIVITSTLLLLWFLDNPYHEGAGSLRPVAMERTLDLLTSNTGIARGRLEIPCDARGASAG